MNGFCSHLTFEKIKNTAEHEYYEMLVENHFKFQRGKETVGKFNVLRKDH